MIGSVSDMENNYSPLDALRDVDASRTDTARRLYTPWWYHPALGLGLACLAMAVAYFDEAAIFWPLVVVAFVLPVTIAMAYRRITGVWINWPEAGPEAAKLGVVFTVILAAALGLSYWIGTQTNPLWALPVAVALWLVTIPIGRGLDARMREHVRTRAGEVGAP